MKSVVMRILATAFVASALLSPVAATAALVQFAPPNDQTGGIYSGNDNDSYDRGRGVVFAVTADTAISGVGIWQNLSKATVSYSVQRVTGLTGDVSAGAVTLVSGAALSDTGGQLAFVDFTFPAITLLAGNDYYIDFSFEEPSNQNFFYNNQNVSFTVGNFASIDGTAAGDARNFVMPLVRVSTVDAVAVPEPMSLALLGMGMVGTGMVRRRKAG